MAYTTINKPSDYFSADLWSGNSSTQSINVGKNFSSNGSLIWIKGRNSSGFAHRWIDSVRGKENLLASNSTDSQFTESGDGIASYSSTGFNLQFSSQNDYNESGGNYVGWNWLASLSPSGSANTDGTISSTVSANTTSGFSIVKYIGNDTSGATVGHGLGVVPKMIIVKRLSGSAQHWQVYHISTGNTKSSQLSGTGTPDTSAAYWNNTSPTNSVFTIGNGSTVNGGGGSDSYIAYCFAEKQGYSKFGSYTGNNSNDGPFIYTGFKPAFVMIKNAHDATNWSITDNKRAGFNVDNDIIYANTSGAEDGSYQPIDHLSNGFKIRLNTEGYNGDGGDYIYMAFSEAPLVGTNGVTAKAR